MAGDGGAERGVALADVGAYAASVTITEGLAPRTGVRGLDLDGCRVVGLSLSQARLVGCTFVDCRFESVDLSMADLVDSRFTGCTFVSCRMLGLGWSGTAAGPVLDPNVFEDCRMDDASFAGCDLSGTTFRRCRLRDADSTGTDLRRVDFQRSDLMGARFDRADLRGASLVGAIGWVLDPRENRVKGLRVDATGALGLLPPLGIDIV